MFDNIGRKIKYMAKFVFYVIVFVVFILACTTFGKLGKNPEFEDILGSVFLFLGIMAIGTFFAWIFVLFLYAFGELVDSNQIQVKQNNTLIKLLSGKKPDTSTNDTEENKINYSDYTFGQIMNIPSNTGKTDD